MIAECFRTSEEWGRDRNARLTWSRQRKSWLSEPVSFFKIGVDLNGMSVSEYLPLYQSFTNRTHIRNGRRFDHSEISQTIEKNKWCVILSGNVCGYVNLPITYILVSVLPGGWCHKSLLYLDWPDWKVHFEWNVTHYRWFAAWLYTSWILFRSQIFSRQIYIRIFP